MIYLETVVRASAGYKIGPSREKSFASSRLPMIIVLITILVPFGLERLIQRFNYSDSYFPCIYPRLNKAAKFLSSPIPLLGEFPPSSIPDIISLLAS